LHYALCAMRYALCVMRYALCAMRYALCAMRYALCGQPFLKYKANKGDFALKVIFRIFTSSN
jgi:hypothetical protein